MNPNPTIQNRVHKPNGNRVNSQTRLAVLITQELKVPCTKQLIQTWQRNWTPPFPPSLDNGDYDKEDCFKWVREVYMPRRISHAQPDLLLTGENAKQELAILKAKREKFDFEREQGLFIEKEKALRARNGAVRTYHSFVRRSVETYLPDARRDKLIQLGATQEIISLFHEFDVKSSQTVIDNIESQCAKVTENEIIGTND